MNSIEVKVAIRDTDFVGLKIRNDNVKITFPIGYDIEENTYFFSNEMEMKILSDDFSNLMKVLENAPTGYYDEGEIKFNFSSAISIMKNYTQHGLYREEDDITRLEDRGKINWKETMINVKPILWNHSMVYSEFYVDRSCNIDSVITVIQKFCINYINLILWWMYGTNNGIVFPEIDMNMQVDKMIYELNRKLHEVNDDYSKKVINDMLLFLNGTKIVNISENEEICVGRKYFDKIWERQLRSQIYSDFIKCEDAYPTTYYVLDEKNKIINNSLIPDIVFKVDKLLIIIDAKYYMIGTFPKSSDICKQLFYEKYLRKKYKKIINAFILPNNMKERFNIKGYASAEGFEDESKIEICYLDTKAMLKNKNALKDLITNLIQNR